MIRRLLRRLGANIPVRYDPPLEKARVLFPAADMVLYRYSAKRDVWEIQGPRSERSGSVEGKNPEPATPRPERAGGEAKVDNNNQPKED